MTTSPDTASLKPARCVPSPPGWSAILPPSGHTGDPGPRRGAGGTQLLWYNTAGKVSWRQPPGVLSPPPPLRRVSPFVQPGPYTNNLVRTIEDIEHLAQQRSIVDIRPGNCRISLRMGRDYREGLPIPPKHQRITGRRAPQRPPRLTTNRRGQGAQTASPYLRSPASPCSQYTGRTIGPVGFQRKFDEMLAAVARNDPSCTVLQCHDAQVPLLQEQRDQAWLIRFGNTGQPEHVEMIAAALKECSVVRTVDFSYCLVGNSAMKVLMSGLNSSVVHLYVAGNSLRAAVASSLNGALKKMHFLQTLNLRDNCLGEAGAVTLAEGLYNRPSLTSIDLARNRIGAVGTEALAAALGSCTALKKIGFFYNGIMDRGTMAIAALLKKCAQLEEIDLGANEITDAGVVALCHRVTEKLYGWPRLSTLELRANQIGDSGARALAELLSRHPVMRTVRVDGNRIQNEGSEALIRGLGDAAPLIVPGFKEMSPHRRTLARTTAFEMRTVSAEMNRMRVDSPTETLQLTKKLGGGGTRPKPNFIQEPPGGIRLG